MRQKWHRVKPKLDPISTILKNGMLGLVINRTFDRAGPDEIELERQAAIDMMQNCALPFPGGWLS